MRRAAGALLGAVLLVAAPARAGAPSACPFGRGDLPVTTLPPGTPHGAHIPIDHIVVLMQENRSFDHYLGRLHAAGQPNAEAEPRRASNPNPLGGRRITAFHQTHYCEIEDLGHSWNETHREWNGGAMDGFTAVNAIPADPTGRRTMGFYRPRDLRFYYSLYRTFAMADRYFCSLLSQTFPNRFYLVAGTSFGHIRNDGGTFTQPTIFKLLDDAGIDWRIYAAQFSVNQLVFKDVKDHPEKVKPITQYFSDAATGTLPPFSFVEPIYAAKVNVESDEHPPSNVQVGQHFVSQVIQALFASPQWPSSALFLTYDEHGGFFDHVPPPPACMPDGIPPQLERGDEPGAFDRYGIRVPAVVVSPFARRRFVSHTVYDHTSILRFVETRFDLPALTARDANADPMLGLFDFQNPPFRTPPRLAPARVKRRRLHQCAREHP